MYDLLISMAFIVFAIVVMCVATLLFRAVCILTGILYREILHAVKHGHRPFGPYYGEKI